MEAFNTFSLSASLPLVVNGDRAYIRERHECLRSQIFAKAETFTVETARSSQALDEAAAFFVDAFWVASTSITDPVKLTPNGHRALCEKQRDDMEERYGELVGVRRLRSELLLAREASGGIAGCIGLELAVMSVFDKTVLPRK